MNTTPTWSLILEAARELGSDGAEFSRSALVDAVLSRDPNRRTNTIGANIQSMTRNATGGLPCPGGTPLERTSQGWYRLVEDTNVAVESTRPPADVMLIGSVETKARHVCRARDLYLSPLFTHRRRYAERRAEHWYIISAEHGLLAPDTMVEPYEADLADQDDEYRRAWGHWVVAKLSRIEGDLRGLVIEIHGDETSTEALRQPLATVRAVIRRPLAGLTQDEEVAWYDEALRLAGDKATEVLRETVTMPRQAVR